MENKKNEIGVGKLVMFAVGTTLASGVFSLSGDFAASGAHQLATLIGWGICGLGMIALSMCFFRLSVVRNDLTSGLYSYAREGFGAYMGFNSAWGYFISAILAQLSFITLLFAALGNFFPIFGEGSNAVSMIIGSVIIWALAFLILKGVNEAVTLNVLVVCAKAVPIVVVIVAILFAGTFDIETFTHNMTGAGSGMSVFEQVKATTAITVWTFVGIEGAVVISGRAKSTRDSGKATIISFLTLLALYVLISILSMGVMTTEELASLDNPPLAGLLEHVVGPWGATLVSIAVILSLGGAMFTYSILCVECAYGPASQQCFPKVLTKVNKNNAPTWSVLLQAIIVQLFVIIIYFNASSYQAVYTLSTSMIMIPYGLSAFYCLKLTMKGFGMENESSSSKTKIWIYSILGAAYGVWMIYAAGLQLLLMSSLLYGPGVLLYVYTRKENGEKLFPSNIDKGAVVLIVMGMIYTIYGLVQGSISLF